MAKSKRKLKGTAERKRQLLSSLHYYQMYYRIGIHGQKTLKETMQRIAKQLRELEITIEDNK